MTTEERYYCEAALHELGDAVNGTRHDSSWIRPKIMSKSENQEACIQAYHWLRKALDEKDKPA